MNAPTPPVRRLLETALQVADLRTSAEFYERRFGFPRIVNNERLCAFDVCGSQVLLLFAEGQTEVPLELPGGVIPGHGAAGRLHYAFAIDATDLKNGRSTSRPWAFLSRAG
jgi:catechol 2,3-dioxygenase-like lactoylglutathione lyase family enzyme